MRNVIETLSILIAIGIVLIPIGGFISVMRHFARKEREVLQQYGLLDDMEVEYE